VLSAICMALVVAIVDHKRVEGRISSLWRSLDSEKPPAPVETVLNRYEIGKLVLVASRQYNLPSELILAIIEIESNFNQNAVSPVGAMGLMQLMPLTARELKVGDPFNPVHNIYGGVKYFNDLLRRFNGNKELALAAYNAGPGAVQKHGGIPPYSETRNYVKKVMKAYRRNVRNNKNLAHPKLQRT